MERSRRAAAAGAVVVVLSAVAAGVGSAAPSAGPVLVGTVTKVSRVGRFIVVDRKVVVVTRPELVRALARIAVGRRVKVEVIRRAGRYYATNVQVVGAAAAPSAQADTKPT